MGRMKLKQVSLALSQLAARVVHVRHQQEAFEETRQLRAALEWLIENGVGVADLVQVLEHPDWENKLTRQLTELGMVK